MGDRERRLLGLLGLAVLFEGYGRSLVSVTLPEIGRDLGVAAPELSFALAVITAGALGVLVIGALADRFGRRRVLLTCIAGYALLGTGTAFAAALPQLIAWQAGARVFQEGALYMAAVIAAEEMPAARRGTAQGVIGVVNNMGSGLVAFNFGFIRYWPGGWRGLALVALAPLLLLPLFRRAIPESRRWLATGPPTRWRPPVQYRGRLVVLALVTMLGTGYEIAGFAFASYYPITVHGWSPGAASAMIIIAGAAGLPGWWLGGWLADEVGRRPTAVLFLSGLTLAQAAFYLGPAGSLFPAFAAMVFCQGGKTVVLRAWATELFPTDVRGTMAAWLSAAATAGGMAGLALVGAVMTSLGSVGPALTLVALGGLVAAAVAVFLPETCGLELETIAPPLG